MPHNYLFYFFIALLLMSQFACSNSSSKENRLEKNLARAGKNRAELEKVLAHYSQSPEDNLKKQAALALISNMDRYYHYSGEWLNGFDPIFQSTAGRTEGEIKTLMDSTFGYIGLLETSELHIQNDLLSLDAAYLIENIDQAVATWQGSPWRDSISFETFCNFILPYKNYSEYPESWRASLYGRYRWILEDSSKNASMVEVCTAFNEDLKSWFRFTGLLHDYPGRLSISNMMLGQVDNCSDMSGVAAYIGRSLGLPVALDFMPQWACGNAGHAWNALIINDKESIPFLGAEGNPGSYWTLHEGEGRIAKVYRRLLFAQENSFAAAAKEAGISLASLPGYSYDLDLLDVTDQYGPVADITITLENTKEKAVYLCILKEGYWIALSGAIIQSDGTATFKNMGRALTYMPMYYAGDENYTNAGYPLLLTFDGELKELKPDPQEKIQVELTRKSPISRHITKFEFADRLNGARIEGANNPDFKNPTTLHTIGEVFPIWNVTKTGGIRDRDQLKYVRLWEEAKIGNQQAFRYVRIKTAEGELFRLGDIAFFDSPMDSPLSGQPIGTVQNPEWAFDGTDGHSIIYDEYEPDKWVGLDLGEPKKINKVRYIPAQDRNRILPGRTYQFLYWDQKWNILDTKTSTGLSLEFENVPKNALYQLHCLDCEFPAERPFTYEKGIQVWW